METATVSFDTHDFVKRLTSVGMPEAQAEVLAQGQSDLYERLVTKAHFEFTLTHELEKLRVELKHDIETVKAELKLELEKVRADLEQKLSKQEAANRQALKELELTLTHNMKEMEHKLTIRLGAFMAAGVTLLAALITFF